MTFRRRPLLAAAFGFAALAALTPTSPARALTPYRVADLDPIFRSAGSRPERFVRVGGRTLFTARTPGLGLWSSNGTAAGTVRLLRNQQSIEILTATGDLVFFFACDSRCRLRATDGTVAGTRVVAGPYSAATQTAVAGPRRIFFVHDSPATGRELWTSDGTAAGTRLVKDLAPGPAGSSPNRLVWFRDRLWFFALDGLWTSDGKASGTRRIATVGTGFQAGPAGTRLLFFAAAPGASEVRLWSSDGTTAGTRVLPGVAPLPPSTLPPFASNGTDAFFFVSRGASPDDSDEVWASDGTPSRTRRLAQFRSDAVTPKFVVVGPRVGFIAFDDEHGSELWASDGRPAGTRVLDICPGECSGAFDVGAADGPRVWFGANDDETGTEPWSSDLTLAGSRRLKDIHAGFSSSNPSGFVVGGGKAYFAARTSSEVSLWVSDGTPAGTRQVARPSDDDSPLELGLGAIANGRLFFRRNDARHGAEPWVSDGTPAGTALIADLEPSQDGGSSPYALRAGAGRCFLFANEDSNRNETELWSSNGSVAGTVLTDRFENRRFSSSSQIRAADLGSRIALLDVQFSDRAEIWISDGTADGTFRAHSDDQRPTGRFRVVGGRLFFEAFDADHGLELWTSDGTPAGTLRLSDFDHPEPFPELFESTPFRVLGGRLAFLAADPFGRLEPWVSDGTIGGTRHLADVYPALVAPFFELSSDIVQVGGKYFFVSGERSEVGSEPALWVTDLSAEGTRKVGPMEDSDGDPVGETGLFALGGRLILFYGGGNERGFRTSDGTDFELGRTDVGLSFGFGTGGARAPVVWNDRLVFLGDDERLYTTDGTAAGTTRIVRANGQEITRPSAFAVLGNRLAFADSDGIWETDGTPAGTVRRLAARTSDFLTDFVRAGDRIFFPWYDAATGTELWALRP